MEKEITTARIVAGAVIRKDGRYLLVQEKQPKAYGLWNFPAGHVDVGDTFEQTVILEAKEESGYDVKVLRKIGIFQRIPTESVKHAFEVEIVGGELAFSEDEILDAQWFTVDQIRNMKDQLRDPWVIEVIEILEK